MKVSPDRHEQAGVGIGLVFASLLTAVARNPSMRGQLFSYAILGFAFVEAIGLVSPRLNSRNHYVHADANIVPVRPHGCHDV